MGSIQTTYLDYAATTPVDARVIEAMAPFWSERYGNPNSLYSLGRDAFTALEDARKEIAGLLGAGEPREIVFTGGGTESDNAAIRGIVRASKRGNHLVVSAFEHHAVLAPAESLEQEGFEVTRVRPGEDGVVSPDMVAEAIRDDTALVSVMHVNNELGTVQPIKALAEVAHERGAAFHTDAAQSAGKLPLDVEDVGADAVSLSAHKMYGPKGVGVLYLRRKTPFDALLVGGGQEAKRRSGTQNVAGVVGMATAYRLMVEEMDAEAVRLAGLRDRIAEALTGGLENVVLNGATAPRVPGIANFLIKGVEGESMLLHLDGEGFAVSTGSACSSASLEPSHVLMAIGCPQELAHGSLRVSVGRFTTTEDVDAFLTAFPPIVERLRSMSPVYAKMFGRE